MVPPAPPAPPDKRVPPMTSAAMEASVRLLPASASPEPLLASMANDANDANSPPTT